MKYNDIYYTALLREFGENNYAFLCANELSLYFDSIVNCSYGNTQSSHNLIKSDLIN